MIELLKRCRVLLDGGQIRFSSGDVEKKRAEVAAELDVQIQTLEAEFAALEAYVDQKEAEHVEEQKRTVRLPVIP